MCTHRQILTFVEVERTPVEPIRAEYLHRGSLQYEFGSELLQTPIQLVRISNAEAQVLTAESVPYFDQMFLASILFLQPIMGNTLLPVRLLKF